MGATRGTLTPFVSHQHWAGRVPRAVISFSAREEVVPEYSCALEKAVETLSVVPVRQVLPHPLTEQGQGMSTCISDAPFKLTVLSCSLTFVFLKNSSPLAHSVCIYLSVIIAF